MLRGVRWLALLCVGLAGAMLDLDMFVREGEVARELPLPLGQRLWYLVPVTVIWIVGALLRYRRRRAGVQLNVRSLTGRRPSEERPEPEGRGKFRATGSCARRPGGAE